MNQPIDMTRYRKLCAAVQVEDNLDLKAMQTLRRRQLSEVHPDKGGNKDKFAELVRVWDELLVLAKRVDLKRSATLSLCQACEGKGFTLQGQGFSKIKVPCQACKTRGRAPKPKAP